MTGSVAEQVMLLENIGTSVLVSKNQVFVTLDIEIFKDYLRIILLYKYPSAIYSTPLNERSGHYNPPLIHATGQRHIHNANVHV